MPKLHALAQYDTKDNRQEIFYLLNRLPPDLRIAWLQWCCRRAAIPNSSVRPRVSQAMLQRADLARRDDSAAEKLTVEVFFDWVALLLQYNLDADVASAKLVDLSRRAV